MLENKNEAGWRLSPIATSDAFTRQDETEDSLFYARDRFVSHLDDTALATVASLIENLVMEEHPAVLDLMAGWDSHVPSSLKLKELIGLGLNENELKSNQALTRYVVHDVNKDPVLPLVDSRFDVVINTVSVDYLVRPVEVFRQVERVLKPGGLFLVIFSNRMFPQKAVKVWRDSSEDERIILVEEFFSRAGGFEKPEVFISRGKPRPADDKYADILDCSDPIFAVYAEKRGGDPAGKERKPTMDSNKILTPEELAGRKADIARTHACPYCGEPLQKWAVPDNPFGQTWDNDYMYVCFNDGCPYYVRGWEVMQKQNRHNSYRLMYHPEKNVCQPLPVPTSHALREGIIE